MHHYPFHIGDYRKDTGRLSILGHGIYRLLIDTYYESELPLCLEKSKLARQHGIRTPEELSEMDAILDDYFSLLPDGYHHSGCDKVLRKIYEKSEKAKLSAEAKWAKHREKMRNTCERSANAYENHANASKNDADDMLPITHNPLPITQDKTLSSPDGDDKALSRDKIDYQGIIDLYHSILPELPRVVNLTNKRRTAIKTCATTKKSYSGLDFWQAYFEAVRKSDFLMGRSKEWRADIDFLIRHSAFVKVIEGSYS